MKNYMKLEILALSANESFARNAVAAFALSLNPTVSELSDIKTAVSEAVTNCIVHAYRQADEEQKIVIECTSQQIGDTGVLHITISDKGCGIENLTQALAPFFTTLEGEERSGMGFTIMQTFMSDFSVKSERGKGTTVKMSKLFSAEQPREKIG